MYISLSMNKITTQQHVKGFFLKHVSPDPEVIAHIVFCYFPGERGWDRPRSHAAAGPVTIP